MAENFVKGEVWNNEKEEVSNFMKRINNRSDSALHLRALPFSGIVSTPRLQFHSPNKERYTNRAIGKSNDYHYKNRSNVFPRIIEPYEGKHRIAKNTSTIHGI